jgi:SAM-dependent methyltransferase
MKADFGATAKDYARHRAGFPDSLFRRLAAFEIGEPGQVVVDLGTGTGSLARGFASRGCRVIGIDIAKPLLEAASQLDAAVGVRIDYRIGRAEATGLPEASVDVVTAGQCWHWFDRPRAAAEITRILRPEGRIVIAHFDWVPLPGNLVRATEELIERHNPEWRLGGGYGLHPLWLRDLGMAGFREIETFSYDVEVPYTPEGWRGRIRASAGVGGSMTADRVEAFDRALEALLGERFPGGLLHVPHRVSAVLAKAPARPGDRPRPMEEDDESLDDSAGGTDPCDPNGRD